METKINLRNLTREQAVALVGTKIVEDAESKNCEWYGNNELDQVEKWTAKVSFEKDDIYHGVPCDFLAVYYQPLYSTNNVEDLGSLNWEINHYEIQ